MVLQLLGVVAAPESLFITNFLLFQIWSWCGPGARSLEGELRQPVDKNRAPPLVGAGKQPNVEGHNP